MPLAYKRHLGSRGPHDMSDGFGGRFRQARTTYRTDRGVPKLSLQAVADHFGISKPSVAAWEKGVWPEKERMVPLANLLGVDPTWLYFGTGLPERTGHAKIAPYGQGGNAVPIVSADDAASDFDNAIENPSGYSFVPDTPGPRWAWLTIWDRSNYPEMDIGHSVVVDADQPVRPGDWCFARVGESCRPVIGILSRVRDGGSVLSTIETVNDKWPNEVLGPDDAILAKVIRHTRTLG